MRIAVTAGAQVGRAMFRAVVWGAGGSVLLGVGAIHRLSMSRGEVSAAPVPGLSSVPAIVLLGLVTQI